jgi:hypothetical protein
MGVRATIFFIVLLIAGCNDKPEFETTNDLSAYPNPTDGYLGINVNNQSNQANVSVFGTKGETLLSESLGSGYHQLSISLDNKPSGIYYVTLNTGSNTFTKRIIKL